MKQICPICNKEYTERPALSRIDNKTGICPDCGYRQAIKALVENKQYQEVLKKHPPLSRTRYEEAKANGEDIVFVDVVGNLHTMEEAKKHFEDVDKLVDSVYAHYRKEKQEKKNKDEN